MPVSPQPATNCSGWKVWKPEQDRHGAAVDLRADREARRGGLGGEVELAAPGLGVGVVLGEDEADRALGGRGEAAHPVHLALGSGQVLAERAGRSKLEHAGVELAEHRADAEQLVFGGEGAGHGLTVDGPVGQRARRGEAERAGPDALAHDVGHGRDVLGSGRLVLGAPLPHDVAPHRAVRHLGAQVHHVAAGVERVEELGERLPAPLDAVGQRGAGDVLDALHEADEPLVTVGRDRREPHAAVAHHHGGDAVPARGGEQLVPGGLAVVVGVDVDEARGDERPVGVDLPSGRAVDATDIGDDAVGDGHVGGAEWRAGAVGDGSPADHQIVHVEPPGSDDVSGNVPRSTGRPLTGVSASLSAAGRPRSRPAP